MAASGSRPLRDAKPGIREIVLSDLKRGDLRRTLRRDFRDLYDFYLDDDARAKLAGMNRVRRGWVMTWWILKSLVMRLSPTRRLLLLLGFLFFLVGDFTLGDGTGQIELHFQPLAFLALLLILMLELRDKLLARDELEVGRAVQLALLPDRMPELPGWDIWMYTRPANDVGGDLVDYLPLPGGRLALALGDVAGKGLGAALLMSKLQATLRALASDHPDLAELGRRVNGIFCRDGVPGRFATLVFLVVGEADEEVRVLNAGHPSPILICGARAESLEPVALPLGVLPEAAFEEQPVLIPPGATLLVYSDGVTEATNAKGDFFEDDYLAPLIPRLAGLTAEAAGRLIIAEVERFAGEERASDDLSLILLRRL